MKVPSFNLRFHSKGKMQNTYLAPRVKRQTPNPYKTQIGRSHSTEHKLKAAALCNLHGISWVVPLTSLEPYKHRKRVCLLCKVCLHHGIRSATQWGCSNCGCEFHITPCTWGSNRSTVSCADAAHQQNKINIDDLTVIK